MKGKDLFSAADADEICAILRELRRADRLKQKKLRGILRKKYRFHIMDFDAGRKGFSEADFDALAEKGAIGVR